MKILEMNVEDVAKKLTDDCLFVDVREPDEFDEVHAKGVKNLPLAQVSAETVGLDNKDKKVYLICRSGKRSMMAAQKLEQDGFSDLVNVEGGTLAWIAAGLETE